MSRFCGWLIISAQETLLHFFFHYRFDIQQNFAMSHRSLTTAVARRASFSMLAASTQRAALTELGKCVTRLARDPKDRGLLLQNFLSRPSNSELLSQVMPEEIREVFRRISNGYRLAADIYKPMYSSLVTSLTYTQLQSMGFSITRSSYQSGMRHAASDSGAGSFPKSPHILSSKQSPTIDELGKLKAFLLEHSALAANHAIRVGGVWVPQRRLALCIASLSREWNKKNDNSSMKSRSTFTKYVKGFVEFLRHSTTRKTDMCEYCVKGGHAYQKLGSLLAKHDQRECTVVAAATSHLRKWTSCVPFPSSETETKVPQMCSCPNITAVDRSNLNELLPQALEYLFHYAGNKRRRDEYREQYENLKVNEVQITLDFKENVQINTDPVENSKHFFNRTHRSVLGFYVRYKDSDAEDAKVCTKYIDFVSSCLSHDSYYVIGCLYHLVEHCLPVVPENLHIWSDRGPHFCSNEFVGAVTVGLRKTMQKLRPNLSIFLHFFVEKHGKSPIDGHFSMLHRWIKELASKQPLLTTDALVKGLCGIATSSQDSNISYQFINWQRNCADPNHPAGYHDSAASCQQQASTLSSVPIAQNHPTDRRCDEGALHCGQQSSIGADSSLLSGSTATVVSIGHFLGFADEDMEVDEGEMSESAMSVDDASSGSASSSSSSSSSSPMAVDSSSDSAMAVEDSSLTMIYIIIIIIIIIIVVVVVILFLYIIINAVVLQRWSGNGCKGSLSCSHR